MTTDMPVRPARIEVHVLSAPERRMLLELLASERSGEPAVRVVHLGRDEIARSLCALQMTGWVSPTEVVFTEYGRTVAESLAARLIARAPTPAS